MPTAPLNKKTGCESHPVRSSATSFYCGNVLVPSTRTDFSCCGSIPSTLEDGRRHLRGRNRGLHGSVMASSLVSFLRRSLESTSAPTPPAELTPAVTMVAVEMHSGHIGWLLLFVLPVLFGQTPLVFDFAKPRKHLFILFSDSCAFRIAAGRDHVAMRTVQDT